MVKRLWFISISYSGSVFTSHPLRMKISSLWYQTFKKISLSPSLQQYVYIGGCFLIQSTCKKHIRPSFNMKFYIKNRFNHVNIILYFIGLVIVMYYCWIWCSHISDCKAFQRNILPPPSGSSKLSKKHKEGRKLLLAGFLLDSLTLKMEVACSSKMSMDFYQTTRCYIQNDSTFHHVLLFHKTLWKFVTTVYHLIILIYIYTLLCINP
jgi:hypothetical protein